MKMEKLKKYIVILSSILIVAILVIIYLLIINTPMIEDTGEEIERKWLINIDNIPLMEFHILKARTLRH